MKILDHSFGYVPETCGACPLRRQIALSGDKDMPLFWVCGHEWGYDHQGNYSFIDLDLAPEDFCPRRIEKHFGWWRFMFHRIKVFFGVERPVRSLKERTKGK